MAGMHALSQCLKLYSTSLIQIIHVTLLLQKDFLPLLFLVSSSLDLLELHTAFPQFFGELHFEVAHVVNTDDLYCINLCACAVSACV